jgi:uncharacterized protein (UPF0335 family)
MTTIGHNTEAASRIASIIARVERLEEDKAAILADIKEVYAEAKGDGYDTKVLRKIVRMRKQDAVKLAEEEAVTELYLAAIGGL